MRESDAGLELGMAGVKAMDQHLAPQFVLLEIRLWVA
jgi:hypothetical protein